MVDAERLVECRGDGYGDPFSVWKRTGLSQKVLELLARGDVFSSMGLSRREALWAIRSFDAAPLPLFVAGDKENLDMEPKVNLPDMGIGEQLVEDYSALNLSLRCHPLTLLRDHCGEVLRMVQLATVEDGTQVSVCGLVLVRQRPSTAKGVIFMTLEDETGVANVIIWHNAFERYRHVILAARLVRITGELQRQGIVTHVIAERIEDLSHILDHLGEARDLMPLSTHSKKNSDPLDPGGHSSRIRGQADSRSHDKIKVSIKSRNFH